MNDKLHESYLRSWSNERKIGMYVEGRDDYAQHISDMVTEACKKIGLERANYDRTTAKFMADPDKRDEMVKI